MLASGPDYGVPQSDTPGGMHFSFIYVLYLNLIWRGKRKKKVNIYKILFSSSKFFIIILFGSFSHFLALFQTISVLLVVLTGFSKKI